MKKLFLIMLACLLVGCSTIRYHTYYPNGQVRQEFEQNVLIGTLDGVFAFVFALMKVEFCAPFCNKEYYLCPGN